MSLKQLITNSEVFSCEPDTPLSEVAVLMKQHDVGSIIVEENAKPTGILTDRDIILRCLAQHQGAHECKAKDVMTSPVETIGETAGIHELIEFMKEKEIRRVVVTNDDDDCLAVVSMGDVLALLAEEMHKLAESSTPGEIKLQKDKAA